MLCKKPYRSGVSEYGCGQCLPCLVSRRRLWTHRMMLEAALHGDNAFVTLTYGNEADQLGSVSPDAMQLWMKRLRKRMSPVSLRYYLIGDYGDESWHAHYHAIVFGMPTCERGRTFHKVMPNCCRWCRLVQETWPYGAVDLGLVEEKSCQYVANYVTKKMTNEGDVRLQGRHPVFARMSLNPGIGARAMSNVASVLQSVHGARLLSETGDVPNALRHGKTDRPLGRYLKRKLREEVGFENVGGQEKPQRVQAEELRALCEVDGVAETLSKKRAEAEVRILQLEGRSKIYKSRGSI